MPLGFYHAPAQEGNIDTRVHVARRSVAQAVQA